MLHQAPGGNSSINLADDYDQAKIGASANSFARGTNQNQGNFLTERPTTRLHQAPGGNSSINLSDNSFVHPVGVASSPFVTTNDSNASIRVKQAPGGATSICLADNIKPNPKTIDFSDENIARTNIPQNGDIVAKTEVPRQAPGGNATVILG